MARANTRNGLLFTLPALVGLLVLTAYPVFSSLYYSFCSYSALKPAKWVGLANYQRLIHDPLARDAALNTLYYAVFSVPLGIVVAFLLAMLLNTKVKGLAFFRTLFYIPSIVPMVAGSVLWLWVLNPQYGILNWLLGLAIDGVNAAIHGLNHFAGCHIGAWGAVPPGWLSDPVWAKPALILMSAWGVGGSMVIFLAGLQGVPQDQYEAAELDGASPFQKMRYVTVPFMSPYLLFSVVMGLIGSFQYFTQAWVMTGGTGSPAGSTMFYCMYLFQNAFQQFKMGYACALAWALFVAILLATLVLFKTSARLIYYGDR